ncbi:MAG: thiamine pyrophosphate-dependent enzyme [Candidatus Muiribacteriota bacterium]
MSNIFDMERKIDIAWCPGCGNFMIRKTLLDTLEDSGLTPEQVVICSGIGQAAKMPQYIKCNYFNGLHGRSLPVATAVKASNSALTVIAESGDGCTYGEGGNHFLHTIRRNPDITNIVHNNMIYGLTKGQGSPTTMKGVKTTVQVNGYFIEPFDPIGTALSNGAGFVARVCTTDTKKSAEVLKQAIEYPGYALVDFLHPCVSFNKNNNLAWYKENTYWINNHDKSDIEKAFSISRDKQKLSLGILYKKEMTVFRKRDGFYTDANDIALTERNRDVSKLKNLINSFR